MLGFLKFMITQQRVPISAVSMTINGQWQRLSRSGDGFWQPTQYDSNNPQARSPYQIGSGQTGTTKPRALRGSLTLACMTLARKAAFT